MQINVVGTVMLMISVLIVVGGEVNARRRRRALEAATVRPGVGRAGEPKTEAESLVDRRAAFLTRLTSRRRRGVTTARDRASLLETTAAPRRGVTTARGHRRRRADADGRQSSVAAFVSTSRRICSISSKCSWSQISGGASWTTGSPRSSARQ